MGTPNKIDSVKEALEGFIYSDSVPATAGKFLLMALALGAIPIAGAVAPGLLYLMKERRYPKQYTKRQLQYSLRNLRQRKLVEIIEEGDKKFKIQLTNKGKKRIKELCFETMKIKKPVRWDKKWRILIFDIPTKPKIYHQAREALRHKIKELGFHQLQRSVWIHPYPCEDEILFVAELFNVQKYIEILTVEKLLHEHNLKRIFRLL